MASALVSALLIACDAGGRSVEAALETMTTGGLVTHIQVLASDSLEGRGPSSPGEAKTIAYLRGEFAKLGLRPGNVGGWFQEAPLVAMTADRNMVLSVSGQSGTRTFRYGDDFIGFTRRVVQQSQLDNSEVVFAGYGVVAPEYGWNDYAGLDARGKTVVVLVNDPGFATGDTALFHGRTMTYYGRWTYKFEEAARQGAAGVLIVHETEPAAYPWEVVTGSWGGEQFGLVAKDSNMSRAAVEGWLTVEAARSLFTQAGRDYDSLKALAMQRGFKPLSLGLRALVTVRNRIRSSTSNNVIALLPGAARPDEYVIYMAHWDHLGRDTSLQGDDIYNGALDNASGTAGLLALAQAFASLERPPQRSIVFLAVTAEEQGLIGSAHYAQNPVYPHNRTAAVINMDGLNHIGPMRDITVIGYGNSELDDYLAEAALTQSRVLKPDAEPEKGFYYRSDHFNFAKAGVPALYTDAGVDHVERGETYAREQRDKYTAERYHKPSDEYDPTWDLRGAIDDLQLLFRVGHQVANETTLPNWKPGTEFRATRDSMMAAAARALPPR
ncbi:MAG: M28 family peptidase [Gemmatimonadetes bacterium]|nr:M28 family peptidase [Gemmatimonadota bacterium]